LSYRFYLVFSLIHNYFKSTVIRSPSATNAYRHFTPPKELPSPQYQQQQQQNFMQIHSSNGNNGNGNVDNEFVVHRSKGITTLFNNMRQVKEKSSNNDSRTEERGE
jgi:hypothetical protein